MQPIIGITMCFDSDGLINQGVEYNYIRREYGRSIRRAGGQPLFLDPSIDPLVAARLCDGIVISGGQDIDPALYRQTSETNSPQEPRARTDWEKQLIEACDEWSRPILGVCYGEQLLNVHYGGSLHQDITQMSHNMQDHGTSAQPVHHDVTFEQDFAGFKQGETVTVTARHHQAVDELAPGFTIAARADDGCIEAIVGNGHIGLQWHAESDATGEIIYRTFVASCQQKMRRSKVLRRTNYSKMMTQLLTKLSVRK